MSDRAMPITTFMIIEKSAELTGSESNLFVQVNGNVCVCGRNACCLKGFTAASQLRIAFTLFLSLHQVRLAQSGTDGHLSCCSCSKHSSLAPHHLVHGPAEGAQRWPKPLHTIKCFNEVIGKSVTRQRLRKRGSSPRRTRSMILILSIHHRCDDPHLEANDPAESAKR